MDADSFSGKIGMLSVNLLPNCGYYGKRGICGLLFGGNNGMLKLFELFLSPDVRSIGFMLEAVEWLRSMCSSVPSLEAAIISSPMSVC